jgi:hypothetical protein
MRWSAVSSVASAALAAATMSRSKGSTSVASRANSVGLAQIERKHLEVGVLHREGANLRGPHGEPTGLSHERELDHDDGGDQHVDLALIGLLQQSPRSRAQALRELKVPEQRVRIENDSLHALFAFARTDFAIDAETVRRVAESSSSVGVSR